MKVVTITNQKGGVSKTTTAHAIGAYLSKHKKKVLLVDLDSQANLTYITGVKCVDKSSSDVLLDPMVIKEAMQEINPLLWIVPADPQLSNVCNELINKTGREYKLKEALKGLSFDYVIIDSPPALSLLTINALTASNEIVVPIQADVLSLKSLKELSETIGAVKKYTNKSLKLSGVLLARYNPRSILTKDMTKAIENACSILGTKLYKAKIREAVAIKEAQAKKTDIFSYAPDSKVAEDYKEFIKEFING